MKKYRRIHKYVLRSRKYYYGHSLPRVVKVFLGTFCHAYGILTASVSEYFSKEVHLFLEYYVVSIIFFYFKVLQYHLRCAYILQIGVDNMKYEIGCISVTITFKEAFSKSLHSNDFPRESNRMCISNESILITTMYSWKCPGSI